MRNQKNMIIKFDIFSKKAFIFESKIIAVLGFFLIGGSIGGYDYGAMTFGKFITYFMIGVCMCAAGMLAVKYFDGFDDDDDENDD